MKRLTRLTRPATREPAGLAVAALAIAGLALGAAATPAQAHTHDSIRYASVKSCADKENGSVPCGPWRLDLHSGERMTLKDARVAPRDRRGKVSKLLLAPIAVSGDGQAVAYYRKSDDRMVVRELGGPVHVMPKIALPKGIGSRAGQRPEPAPPERCGPSVGTVRTREA